MKLSIVGVGLIGGSLGLALKNKLKDQIYIAGYGRNIKNLEEAKRIGAIDDIASDFEEIARSDFIYLSTPVLSMLPIIKALIPFLTPGTIITDAGSTKSLIFDEIKKMLPDGIYYIAGHPMTGREKSGVAAAKADLFEGKMYVIIDDETVPQEAYDKLMRILEKTDARFSRLSIEEHDKAASVISHIPHVAASALVHLLEKSPSQNIAKNLIGGGFRDTTRIASSNADMWADILMSNADCIAKDIDKYIEILSRLKSAVSEKNRDKLYDYFNEGKIFRDNLLVEIEKQFNVN